MVQEGFVVLAHSQAVKEVVPSVHRFMIEIRNSLLKKGVLRPEVDAYRFTQDYVFDSPSTAAGVLLRTKCQWQIGMEGFERPVTKTNPRATWKGIE